MTESSDVRAEQARSWALGHLRAEPAAFESASADASFRRYFRLSADGISRIVMDAPPEYEDCRTFVRIARLLRAWGLRAPQVFAEDLDRGFLLLEDLGMQTMLDVLSAENAAAHYAAARDALVKMQRAACTDRAAWGFLPPYDAELLSRELQLFTDWYLPRELNVELSDDDRGKLKGAMEQLVKSALAQPQVFVHRDYMPRNLMAGGPEPGIIDFQDAVAGPVTYDAVCLFKDAFVSWPDERVHEWLRAYWEAARRHDIPVHDTFEAFEHAADWMGLQRHLKVLGIFARLTHRDGKPKYAADTPRFVRYVMGVAPKYPELRGITEVFERHVLPKVPL